MATILGLALKINADASAVPAALTPVEKALQRLDQEAAKVTKVFENFARASGAAADVQRRFEQEIQNLTDALRAGDINGQQFADGFAAIRAEAAGLAATFAEGARVTEANRTAEDRRAETLQRLDQLLKAGAISEETYTRARNEASGATAAAAKAEQDAERQRAALVAEAARVTESVTTEQEKRQAALDRLNVLLREGVLTEETYQRAVEKTSGATAAAEEAERQRQALLEEGARIQRQYGDQTQATANQISRAIELQKLGVVDQQAVNALAIEKLGLDKQAAASAKARADAVASAEREQAEAYAQARRIEEQAAAQAGRERVSLENEALAIRQRNLTAQERFDQAIARLNLLEQAGVLQKEDYNRELQRQSELFAKATIEAGKTGTAIDAASKGGTLQFNELSGILSALPGPLGNVAGRFSGLASAGEGLSRVFSGGLSAGISGVGSSVAALVNPFTLAAAGVAAFGAGALAVVRGLTALDDRVETLGNTADKLGVSFEFIQTLEESARRSGTSIDAVSAAFGRLQKSVLGVDEESKTAQKALEEIGVTAEELQTLSPERQYERIGSALAGIEDPARRTAAATALFGRAGADLIPFFNNIEKATADVARFGAVLSNIDRGRIDALGDGFDSVFVSLQSLGQSALLPFAGLIEGIARAFSGLINIATAVAQALGTVLTPILDAVGAGLGLVGDAINDTVGFFRDFFGGAEQTAESVSKVADEVERTAEQSKALEQAFANSGRALDSAIAKAGQFGQAGFNAAVQFEEALAELQEQADANELNAEQYSRGVALATAEFEKQIESLQRIQDETRKAAEEAQKRVDADRQVVDALLEQARVNEQFGGDTSRARAADAVLAAEREVARLQEQVAADRNAGNTESAAAGEERIRQLTLIAQQQASIADGSAKAAADEARRVDDQKKRVDALIAASDTRSELEQQLIDVQEQQKLTLDQLIVARQTFNREQADAAAGRLAQLDQLQAKLEDQQQAVEQGFGEGFAQAFQETDRGIDDLIVKAQEFGNVGALAAQALEQGIAQAQAQASAGILTRETYEREVAQQRDVFEQRLQAANRVEEFLRNGVDARQQAELKATEELEKRKKEAAVNVQAIEAKLIEQRKQLEELREKGDLRGARAAQTRVATLERAQREEQALADGRLRQQDQIGQQFLTGLNSAQQFQGLVAQQNDNFLKSFNNTFAGANQALAANAAAAQEQAAKLERLLTPTNQLATTADIRTAEGQQLLLDVANQGIDPALVEARLQTKQLNLIAQGIGQAASNYFNSPVAIVGGAALG